MQPKTEKKIISSIDDLIKENKRLETKLKRANKRIDYLEGSEYGSGLMNTGIEKASLCIIKLLQKFPRNDNMHYKGKLCSTDFIINQEILQLKEKIKLD